MRNASKTTVIGGACCLIAGGAVLYHIVVSRRHQEGIADASKSSAGEGDSGDSPKGESGSESTHGSDNDGIDSDSGACVTTSPAVAASIRAAAAADVIAACARTKARENASELPRFITWRTADRPVGANTNTTNTKTTTTTTTASTATSKTVDTTMTASRERIRDTPKVRDVRVVLVGFGHVNRALARLLLSWERRLATVGAEEIPRLCFACGVAQIINNALVGLLASKFWGRRGRSDGTQWLVATDRARWIPDGAS